MSAGQRQLPARSSLAVWTGVAAILATTFSCPGCGNGCGRTGADFYFYRLDYYTWAWNESGRTLAIGGGVPKSEAEVRTFVLQNAAGCPTAEDAYRYAQDPGEPPDLRVVCVSVELRETHAGAAAGDCVYACSYDYCPSDG